MRDLTAPQTYLDGAEWAEGAATVHPLRPDHRARPGAVPVGVARRHLERP